MSFNLGDKILNVLQAHADQRFTAREIAQLIFEQYPDACRQKQQSSQAKIMPLNNDDALITQIASEIGARRPLLHKKYPAINVTEGRPRLYYFTKDTDVQQITNTQSKTAAVQEHDLYPKLAEFLWVECGVYSKRIDEKRASNTRGKNGNIWLFPDIVGMEDLSRDWHREIKDCVKEYADKKTKLWSFEVKILINRSNVREVFFQTVSNSSWANFAYLVAHEIVGDDTLNELRILSGVHGIGLIKLAQDHLESQIIIPAHERINVDWHTINRVAEENPDFLAYIKAVREFYQTGNVRPEAWYALPDIND